MIDVPDVLADTGSAHMVLLVALLSGLHVEPKESIKIALADQSEVKWDVGQANIRIAGQPQTWTCPVYFCPEDEYLLGAVTLEAFGLMADPIETGLMRKPVRARRI